MIGLQLDIIKPTRKLNNQFWYMLSEATSNMIDEILWYKLWEYFNNTPELRFNISFELRWGST